jgi:hypothetical protein
MPRPGVLQYLENLERESRGRTVRHLGQFAALFGNAPARGCL